MTANDFVCINEIVNQALFLVGNEDFSDGTPESFYVNMARLALNEISIDTFFDKKHLDIFDWNENNRYRVTFPKKAFNLREIYIFTGDEFKIENSDVVHKARNFMNHPKGDGHTRTRKDSSKYTNELYFYNIQNGMIMLSKSCDAKPHLRIVFNGIDGDIGEEPIIPIFFQKYFIDYLKVAHYERAKSKERQARVDWLDAMAQLEVSEDKAKWRIKKMDAKERTEMERYYSRMNY